MGLIGKGPVARVRIRRDEASAFVLTVVLANIDNEVSICRKDLRPVETSTKPDSNSVSRLF